MLANVTIQQAPEVDCVAALELPNVMKVDYVASELSTTQNTVRELLRSGQLRGFQVGTHWRVTRTALLEYIGEVHG